MTFCDTYTVYKVYPAVITVVATVEKKRILRVSLSHAHTHLDDFNDKESGTVILCNNKKKSTLQNLPCAYMFDYGGNHHHYR